MIESKVTQSEAPRTHNTKLNRVINPNYKKGSEISFSVFLQQQHCQPNGELSSAIWYDSDTSEIVRRDPTAPRRTQNHKNRH